MPGQIQYSEKYYDDTYEYRCGGPRLSRTVGGFHGPANPISTLLSTARACGATRPSE